MPSEPGIATLLETGRLQTVVDAVLPLAPASAASTGAVKERRGHGNLVIAVAV
jgi:NADPH:quinone reductase-like Zn-dependent oxidoreductase